MVFHVLKSVEVISISNRFQSPISGPYFRGHQCIIRFYRYCL